MRALQAAEAARRVDLEWPARQPQAAQAEVEDGGPKAMERPDDLAEEHPADPLKAQDE